MWWCWLQRPRGVILGDFHQLGNVVLRLNAFTVACSASRLIPKCFFIWGVFSESSECRVRKGMGSQSVVVCVGKYPEGKSQQQVL